MFSWGSWVFFHPNTHITYMGRINFYMGISHTGPTLGFRVHPTIPCKIACRHDFFFAHAGLGRKLGKCHGNPNYSSGGTGQVWQGKEQKVFDRILKGGGDLFESWKIPENSRVFYKWFLIFLPGEMIHFDEHIFQMGWKLKPPTRFLRGACDSPNLP